MHKRLATQCSLSPSGEFLSGPVSNNNTNNNNEARANDITNRAADFDNMGLKDNLLRGIYGYGFEKPSAIQQLAIMPLIQGGDIIAQAQSGTGKTGAFSIGALQSIDPALKQVQVIIISPTRELARQTHTVVHALGEYLHVRPVLLVGGNSITEAKKQLRDGAQVAICTPGRALDMLERKQLNVRGVRLVVLDEADELLEAGFEEQVHGIMSRLPEEAQVALFSATMPQACVDLAEHFLRSPTHILVKAEQVTLEGIRQFYVDVEREEWKLDTLCDLYEQLTVSQAMIFCSSKRKVEWLKDALDARDHTVSAIHGEMDDAERRRIMDEFKSGSSRILIATDLLARGIDVQQVSLVINYDLPRGQDARENYVHRVGRCGRFGRKGVAVNFLTREDVGMMREIERHYSTQVEAMPVNISDLQV